jgi:hypothetical protein
VTDARNGFRCDPSEEYVVAVLRVAGTEHQVRMINRSSEGFAVGSEAIKLKVGVQVQLRTNRGWSDVEVVRCANEGSQSELGLRLIRDLPDPRDKGRNKVTLFTPSGPRGYGAKAGPLLTVSAVSIVAFWLYMAYSAYRFHH